MNAQDMPGERLKAERCRQQLGETETANRLHLSVTYLRAIEADDYDSLPEATFVKGYLRNYARLLGLPREELAQAFMALNRGREPAVVTPPPVMPTRPHLSRWILPVVVLLVLLAVLGWWFSASHETSAGVGVSQTQQADTQSPSTSTHTSIAPSGEAAQTAAAKDASANTAPTQAAPAAQQQSTAQQQSAAGQLSSSSDQNGVTAAASVGNPPAGQQQVDASSATSAAEKLASQTADAATPAASGAAASTQADKAVTASKSARLRISFSGNCWTKITDAAGKLLFAGSRQSGDNLDVAGKPPFQLVLGNAAGVSDLSVDGKTVALTGSGRGDVVHMQVP